MLQLLLDSLISLSVDFLTLIMQLHIDNIIVFAAVSVRHWLRPKPTLSYCVQIAISGGYVQGIFLMPAARKIYGSGLGTRLVRHPRKGHVFNINIWGIIIFCKISQYANLHAIRSTTLFSISRLTCTWQQKKGVLKTYWTTLLAKELISTSKPMMG